MMIKRVFTVAAMAAVLGSGALAVTAPAHAEERCTPASGFTACLQFQYTGGDQDFLVPSGVAQIGVRLGS